MIPLIPLALSLAAEYAPSLVSWIAGDEAGETAKKVIDAAQRVTGADKPEDIQSILAQKPDLIVQLQLGLAGVELELFKAETERLRVVNQQMAEEGRSEDPFVRRWRPTWGYVSAYAWGSEALAIFLAILGATIMSMKGQADQARVLLEGLGGLISAMSVAWSVALGVLGIQIQARTHEKAGGTAPGLFDTLKTVFIGNRTK